MGLFRLYQDPASVSVLDAYFQPSATSLGSRGPSDAAAYSGGLRTLLTAWAWPNVPCQEAPMYNPPAIAKAPTAAVAAGCHGDCFVSGAPPRQATASILPRGYG